MSAHETPTCVACGSEALVPKASGESGVYAAQCDDCGRRDTYVFPEEVSE